MHQKITWLEIMQQDVVEPHFALLTPLNAVFLLHLHALHPKKKKKMCRLTAPPGSSSRHPQRFPSTFPLVLLGGVTFPRLLDPCRMRKQPGNMLKLGLKYVNTNELLFP